MITSFSNNYKRRTVMSKKSYSKKAVLAVFMAVLLTFSASAMLSTSWRILGNTAEGCRIETLKNNTASFTLEDFNAALSVSTADVLNFTVESLPSDELGALLLGDTDVETGQAIPADKISELRFVPQMDKTGQTKFEYSLSGSEETYYCTIIVKSDGNSVPVAAPKSFHTLMNMRITSMFPVTDEDGDVITYEIMKQPNYEEMKEIVLDTLSKKVKKEES